MSATAVAPGTAAMNRHEPRADHKRRSRGASSTPHRRPSDLPREYRIAYVYRTLGGGLVAEYDPD